MSNESFVGALVINTTPVIWVALVEIMSQQQLNQVGV